MSLKLEDVTYTYSPGTAYEMHALEHINLEIPNGQFVGIIGHTGSGKSTLLNLLTTPGMAYAGKILLDGTELHTVSPESLYETVSVIQQNVFVFNASIRDNVTMFRSFPPEELAQAVRRAQLEALLAERGEDYLCGENGSGLSGGEKQRLSIARAAAIDPEIFIFDDSFSALDYKTDAVLREGLAKQLPGTTKIIVAQRISTIRNADQILVLDRGEIAGLGTHDELMVSCPVYREIAMSQLSEEELKKGGVSK